jgi:uncharacterized DUF497 family protein
LGNLSVDCTIYAERYAERDMPELGIQDRIIDGEERWQTFGMVSDAIMFPAHIYRDDARGEAIRLISARKANPRER